MRLERAACRGAGRRFGSLLRPSMPSAELDPPAARDTRICLPCVFDEFMSVFVCRARMCASEWGQTMLKYSALQLNDSTNSENVIHILMNARRCERQICRRARSMCTRISRRPRPAPPQFASSV